MLTRPAFSLLNAATTVAVFVLLRLIWKCIKPLGKTNTSPFLRVAVYRLLAVSRIPASSSPSSMMKISLARGCVWNELSESGPNFNSAGSDPRTGRPQNANTSIPNNRNPACRFMEEDAILQTGPVL
ncbi:hypothetical protein Mapa_000983 [Marchantia paleacea]|nr:hypothetical protein Mapa_000983 [Marchantia paleacea]